MRRLVFSLALISTITLSGCKLDQMIKMAAEQNLTVSPDPLEVHGGKVEFEVAANLPLKMLKKGAIYTIYPYYSYNGQEVALDGIKFDPSQPPYDDPTQEPRATASFSFDYVPAMKSGIVEIEGEAALAANPEKAKRTPERLKIADGIITTSLLVQDAFYAGIAPHGYNNQEELIPTEVSLFFDQGSSVLRRSEIRSERGEEFDAFIAEKNVTRTVTITGTHSPEGAERINSELAEDRAEAIEKWYKSQMDRYDYQGMADSIEFILKPVVEDWGLFKEKLKEYDGLTDSQMESVLEIVDGDGSFEDKEKRLQKFSFYKDLFKKVYPELRRARTDILTVKPKKTDAEISILAKQITTGAVSADTLTIEELLYAATLTPSLDEQIAIYEAAVKKSDDWTSHNNLGAALLMKANKMDDTDVLETAITHLELAESKNSNTLTQANLVTAYYMQGNKEKAYDAAEKAQSARPSGDVARGINAVKGALEIEMGDYDQALTSFANVAGTATNYTNKGLASLLNGDYQSARVAFNDANEEEATGIAYYLAAVASARLSDASGVVSNLKSAIEADPELKAMAVEDLEFRNYATDAAFTAILD